MTPATPQINAFTIARYFIWKSQQESNPVTNKKLQKLLYYAQAWSLVLRKEKMFPEDIEAWIHGPAVKSVYLKYKEFGFSPITERIDFDSLNLSEGQIGLMDDVWKVYGQLDAGSLEFLSHLEEPWRKARAGLDTDAPSQNVIDPELMMSFYSKKLEEAKAKV